MSMAALNPLSATVKCTDNGMVWPATEIDPLQSPSKELCRDKIVAVAIVFPTMAVMIQNILFTIHFPYWLGLRHDA